MKKIILCSLLVVSFMALVPACGSDEGKGVGGNFTVEGNG